MIDVFTQNAKFRSNLATNRCTDSLKRSLVATELAPC
jgi:hypothetical protein